MHPAQSGKTAPVLAHAVLLALLLGALPQAARAGDGGVLDYLDASADAARASQPEWSSPLATTTALMEQRLRLDMYQQHSGNGADTTELDGGKGLDLIVSPTNEIQIALPPYEIRSATASAKSLAGYGDWTFLRMEQRLFSASKEDGDYVVTAWLSLQAPTGIKSLTSSAWSLQPTLAFGKGWGDFDVQGTVGAVLPTSNVHVLGQQIQSNTAFQYHLDTVFWPQVEVNWIYYADGQRAGLNQVYLTPGLVVGRFDIGHGLKFTTGLGYQIAVAPSYRARPLTPAYANSLIVTTRMNF
ncbi:MAG TPA: hypothetical protein VHX18_03465 [Rhizomicrobium sp.]|nr:hypothetical protein [Rhizomicrobium sp.]